MHLFIHLFIANQSLLYILSVDQLNVLLINVNTNYLLLAMHMANTIKLALISSRCSGKHLQGRYVM